MGRVGRLHVAEGQTLRPGWADVLPARAAVSGAPDPAGAAADPGDVAVDGVESAQLLGRADVREVFKSSRFGTIAGCLVQSGVIRRNARGRLLRDSVVVADNLPISSLRRFKDDVVEVRGGYECGLTLGNYSDIKVGDVVETFEMREKVRS